MSSTFGLLRRLLQEHGREFGPQYALVVLAMMLVAGMTSLSAYLMKHVVDSIFVNQSQAALYSLTGAIVVIFTVKGLSGYFSEAMLGRIGNRLVAQTQRRMFDHLLKTDVAFFQAQGSSDLITRISHNASAVRDMLNTVSLTFGRDLFTVVGLIVTMIVLDPIMTLLAFVGGPAAVLASRKLVERVRKAAKSEVANVTGIINATRELSQGVQVVKAFQLENIMRKRMFDAIAAVERLSNKMIRIEASVNPMMDSLAGLAVAMVVFYAGWRNINYGDTPGQFFAFITALLMCADPVRRLSRAHLKIESTAIGVQMMYQLLDTPPLEAEVERKPDLQVTRGEVVFNKVTFGYVSKQPIIKEMDLVAPAGKVTALVGLSGGGKSTTLALIQRFREPQSGAIFIDGQNISEYSRASLRRNITNVGQDVFLFDGSILENIRMGLEEATEEQVVAAAKAAKAHDFIMSMPNGYATQTGELGARVSGGQRQRISIARAFLKNAPIVLLDEPTSALDSQTEDYIQRELRELTEGRTTIVIAHRLATILHADLIYVIDNGQAIESGTHEELLRSGGAYSQLFKLQFAKALTQPPPELIN
jgi:ATP-binding cassette subfamily B protein